MTDRLPEARVREREAVEALRDECGPLRHNHKCGICDDLRARLAAIGGGGQ